MPVPGMYNSAKSDAVALTYDDHEPLEPRKSKRILNPVDRISEILFGLIMALTFTCTISIAEAGRTEVRDMLIGAIGCNLAWGLVDAVMFILTGLAERGRGKIILNYVRKTTNVENANDFISEALPPIVSSVLERKNLDDIRKALLKIPQSDLRVKVTFTDIKMATGIFLLVFLSTIPVAIPFAFIPDVQRALRISNLVAIVLMFVSGWLLAKYGGYNKWLMGFFMIFLGIVLVGLTIALGG
jgi:hypothetical protein